jgi:hypothetical protein
MERREIAESALKALCDEMGVPYTTESNKVDGAWFLDTVTRGRVNIMRWTERSQPQGDGMPAWSCDYPLGSSQSQNLTHAQAYEQCWFAFWVLRRTREREGGLVR